MATEVPMSAPTKATRVRTGCLTCRKRHLKCDEAVPACLNCRKSHRICQRGVRLNFLEVSVHQPTRMSFSTHWTVFFQDESREIASEYEGGADRYAPYEREEAASHEAQLTAFVSPDSCYEEHSINGGAENEAQQGGPEMRDSYIGKLPTEVLKTSPSSKDSSTYHGGYHTTYREPLCRLNSTTPIYSAMPRLGPDNQPEYEASLQEQELMAVKERAEYQARCKSDTSSATSIIPLAANTRHRVVDPTEEEELSGPSGSRTAGNDPRFEEREFLSSPEEMYYMQVFVEKVGVWMDSFGSDRNFSRLIPYHALKSTMLLNAFLACGVKHLSLFLPEKEDKALFYYNTATTQLLRSLQNPDRNTAECATAAVVLNVYEIMSEKPTQRMSHIAGARALVRECGWDAGSSGIGSACFWFNIGMEVLSCLAMGWQTTWNPEEWGLDGDIAIGETDSEIGAEELWLHRIFYILARTVNFRALVLGDQHAACALDHDGKSDRVKKWQELKRLCDQWNNACPRSMHPLGYLSPSRGSAHSVFPYVWMLKTAATVGRLLYHTAQLILAQIHPLESDKLSQELHGMQLHHARQICGIVAHSEDRGITPVAIGCLPIASAVLFQPREQEQALTILDRISTESGWRLTGVELELKRAWGWGHDGTPVSASRSASTSTIRQAMTTQTMAPPLPVPGTTSRSLTPLGSFTPGLSTPPLLAPNPMRPLLNPLNFADFRLPNHPYQNWYEPPNRANPFSQRLL